MLTIAKARSADLVIGETRSVGTFRTNTQLRTRRLSEESLIGRDSLDLVHNFSNCNKLFRKSVIDEHHLRYERLRHAEDGLFLYEYISKCGLITGCPRYVYEYNKRLSIDTKSALKSLDRGMFKDAMAACGSIVNLTHDWSTEFCDELNMRILRVTIIGEYYRRFWTLNDDLLSEVIATADCYRGLVGEKRWKQICEMDSDLQCEDQLRTKEDIVAAPLVTVVVAEGLDLSDYLNCLSTLYYQTCPNFEVLVSSAYKAVTPKGYARQENLVFFEGSPLAAVRDLSKGQYINIVREACIYNEDSLRVMIRRAAASTADFVSVKPMAYRDGQGAPCLQLDEVFSIDALAKSREDEDFRASCNAIDTLLSNKLYKSTPLISLLDHLGDCGLDDLLEHSYQKLECERFGNAIIGIAAGADQAACQTTDSPETGGQRRKEKPVSKAVAKASAIRKGVYAVSSRLQPVNRKKVLFLSDTRSVPTGDYAQLKSELEERGYNVSEMYQSTRELSGSRKKQAGFGHELATAGYIVLDDSCGLGVDIKVRRGQKLVQLWHTLGTYKRYAHSISDENEKASALLCCGELTKVVVGSEAARNDYFETHQIDADKVRVTGIPRTDPFFEAGRLKDVRRMYEKKYPLLYGKKIVLIAPTDRDIPVGKMGEYIERFDLQRLHEQLGDEYVFVIKWHPSMLRRLNKMSKMPSQLKKWQKIRSDIESMGSYVLDLSEKGDIDDLLACCDLLVTDYSSILFEYALLKKPIVFFWHDLNAFILDSAAGCDMNKYVYGRIAYRTEDLADAIAASDLCEDRRADFVERYLSACDGRSAERTADWLLSPS
jgi:CDP-ribitol ribitolphosphotransferase